MAAYSRESFRNSPAPHNHRDCLTAALCTAEKLCLERGVQLTPLRHKVLELIWESHKAVKAYDLLDRIKPQENAAKPATVYRALDFLIEQGLIHRVESLNAFIGCNCSERKHEQLLLICDRCCDVEEISSDAVIGAIGEVARQAGFAVQRNAVEIHGLCAACHSADAQSRAETER